MQKTTNQTAMPPCSPPFALLLAGLAIIGHLNAFAGALSVHIQDESGQPLKDAVVFLESPTTKGAMKSAPSETIEQKARKFNPLVSVVQTGTAISFPNNDSVRHHVYSFSPSKTFELQLYSGTPGKPVVFDRSGTVVIGCNIHDRMVGYIQVVDTPFFGKSDGAGLVALTGVPPGKYALRAWHYLAPASSSIHEQTVNVGATESTSTVKLSVNQGNAAK